MIGYPKDTFEAAEQRLRQMVEIGFTPFAMLWKPPHHPKPNKLLRRSGSRSNGGGHGRQSSTRLPGTFSRG
jgi:hypothetical protein